MVITYHGGECFKISQGDLTLAFNPPAKESPLKVSKFGADIVLTSLDHPDFNGVETASLGEKSPFVIQGPGEYETKGIEVHGFNSATTYDGTQNINSIYNVRLEGVNLCFLGALGGDDLPQAAKQELDDVDILFVPIGGEGVFDYATAYKKAVALEPKVIIPMHYEGIGEKDSLKLFLKEAGQENVVRADRLTLKKKDLEGKEGEIVVLATS